MGVFIQHRRFCFLLPICHWNRFFFLFEQTDTFRSPFVGMTLFNGLLTLYLNSKQAERCIVCMRVCMCVCFCIYIIFSFSCVFLLRSIWTLWVPLELVSKVFFCLQFLVPQVHLFDSLALHDIQQLYISHWNGSMIRYFDSKYQFVIVFFFSNTDTVIVLILSRSFYMCDADF